MGIFRISLLIIYLEVLSAVISGRKAEGTNLSQVHPLVAWPSLIQKTRRSPPFHGGFSLIGRIGFVEKQLKLIKQADHVNIEKEIVKIIFFSVTRSQFLGERLIDLHWKSWIEGKNSENNITRKYSSETKKAESSPTLPFISIFNY